jgi:two-component system response regulator MprA
MDMEHRPRALVIDDDAAMREMVVCMLDCAGFDAEAAVDADEGLFALQARPYAVAVCDVHMPRRDGLEFTRAAHRIRPATPVVLMTSFGCDRTRADGAAAGAIGLLSKPFSIRELREAVAAALARTPTATRRSAAAPKP